MLTLCKPMDDYDKAVLGLPAEFRAFAADVGEELTAILRSTKNSHSLETIAALFEDQQDILALLKEASEKTEIWFEKINSAGRAQARFSGLVDNLAGNFSL
jgi:hypothetical protein